MSRIIMYLSILLVFVFSIGFASAQEDTMDFCNSEETPNVVPSIEARAIMLLGSVTTGDPTAAENFISPQGYIQHNLSVPDGKEAFMGLIAAAASDPMTSANFHRVFANGDHVVVHTTFNLPLLGGEFTILDVFRVDEDGKFVEHWDNIQPVMEPNLSGRTAVDGTVIPTDLDKTQDNCELVVEFVQKALIDGDDTVAFSDYINPDMYIQHNPAMADGIDGFTNALATLAEANQVLIYEDIKLVVAQGSFVFIASQGLSGDADSPIPTAYFDLYRVEDNLIVEHWDVISPIPPEDTWQNDNGKF